MFPQNKLGSNINYYFSKYPNFASLPSFHVAFTLSPGNKKGLPLLLNDVIYYAHYLGKKGCHLTSINALKIENKSENTKLCSFTI